MQSRPSLAYDVAAATCKRQSERLDGRLSVASTVIELRQASDKPGFELLCAVISRERSTSLQNRLPPA